MHHCGDLMQASRVSRVGGVSGEGGGDEEALDISEEAEESRDGLGLSEDFSGLFPPGSLRL